MSLKRSILAVGGAVAVLSGAGTAMALQHSTSAAGTPRVGTGFAPSCGGLPIPQLFVGSDQLLGAPGADGAHPVHGRAVVGRPTSFRLNAGDESLKLSTAVIVVVPRGAAQEVLGQLSIDPVGTTVPGAVARAEQRGDAAGTVAGVIAALPVGDFDVIVAGQYNKREAGCGSSGAAGTGTFADFAPLDVR